MNRVQITKFVSYIAYYSDEMRLKHETSSGRAWHRAYAVSLQLEALIVIMPIGLPCKFKHAGCPMPFAILL